MRGAKFKGGLQYAEESERTEVLQALLLEDIARYKINPNSAQLLFPARTRPHVLHFTVRDFIKYVDPQFTTEQARILFYPRALVFLRASLITLGWRHCQTRRHYGGDLMNAWRKDCTEELNQLNKGVNDEKTITKETPKQ